eukprot:44513-Prorocentrum_minimum.AAC.1
MSTQATSTSASGVIRRPRSALIAALAPRKGTTKVTVRKMSRHITAPKDIMHSNCAQEGRIHTQAG